MDRSTTWESVDRLVAWLDRESAAPPDDRRLLRILKVTEEVGEVGQAVIGATGQNPRKGVTHGWEDVQDELCDVVLSALVALRTLTPDAREVFERRLAHVRQRSLGTLATERLELVPLREEHAEEMALVLADPALYAFTGGGPETADGLRARYRRQAAGSPEPGVSWLNWAVRLCAEDRLVGYVQATVTGGTAELAWVVGTPWQGRGIAAEAARAVAIELTAGAADTLVAHIHPDHHASAKVAAALGLTPTDRWYDGERRWQS